ncbi:MAG: hypothetical protein IJS38_02985 [Erysipelotrichaceae bacterium]|nr:hypothetical protein [Erysipelotrichaceae bacterium]
MKKWYLIMITALLLVGCTAPGNNNSAEPQPSEAETVTVTFLNPDGSQFARENVRKGYPAEKPRYDAGKKILYGWFSADASPWDFSNPVSEDLTLKAICYDDYPRTGISITYQDLQEANLRESETNAILVIYLKLTDGHPYDEEFLRTICEKETDSDNRLESIASYYRYNSHGHADFEFHYHCYDTGMTSKQGVKYVQESGNRLCLEAFAQYKKTHQDLSQLDKDGDGYVDLAIIISGEDTSRTVEDGISYRMYGGALGNTGFDPDKRSPEMAHFVKANYEQISAELQPGRDRTGVRLIIHEIGHAYGLMDYYDYAEYEGTSIDSLGTFDMQSYEFGDWNPYSRLSCGWLDPYVITEDVDSVTLKLGCTSSSGEAVLIPTSKGFNGTAFDEYLLIDVLAPEGANGYDWQYCMDSRTIAPNDPKKDGGVRIYHVDSRLLKFIYFPISASGRKPAFSYQEIMEALNESGYGHDCNLSNIYTNSNGYDPYLEGDSRFHHLIDLIPSDGTSKYRLSTPTDWSAFTIFTPKDLFGPGEEFSMAGCGDAFPDGPLMNNGGTLDYSVRVDHYDPAAHEAIITVTRIR